jgi:hypothetical protein
MTTSAVNEISVLSDIELEAVNGGSAPTGPKVSDRN